MKSFQTNEIEALFQTTTIAVDGIPGLATNILELLGHLSLPNVFSGTNGKQRSVSSFKVKSTKINPLIDNNT